MSKPMRKSLAVRVAAMLVLFGLGMLAWVPFLRWIKPALYWIWK